MVTQFTSGDTQVRNEVTEAPEFMNTLRLVGVPGFVSLSKFCVSRAIGP